MEMEEVYEIVLEALYFNQKTLIKKLRFGCFRVLKVRFVENSVCLDSGSPRLAAQFRRAFLLKILENSELQFPK